MLFLGDRVCSTPYTVGNYVDRVVQNMYLRKNVAWRRVMGIAVPSGRETFFRGAVSSRVQPGLFLHVVGPVRRDVQAVSASDRAGGS